MKDRIKAVRKAKQLSQTEFAKKLSVSRSAVSKMESGENFPSEQTIKLICREFCANEEWLRNGTGEMFLKLTKDEEIANMLGEIHNDSGNHFKRRLVAALAKLNESDWDSLEKLVDEIVKQKED